VFALRPILASSIKPLAGLKGAKTQIRPRAAISGSIRRCSSSSTLCLSVPLGS